MDIFAESEVVIDRIAETQGEIYRSAYEKGFDMKDFSEKYLISDFCKNEMDTAWSEWQLDFGSDCLEAVLYEFAQKGITIKKAETDLIWYSPYWVGQVYRYLFYSMKKMSGELVSCIPFDYLIAREPEFSVCEMSEIINDLVESYDRKLISV